jgi:hypothetical protein
MPVMKRIWKASAFETLLVLDKSEVSSCDGMGECNYVFMKPKLFVEYRKGNTSTKTWLVLIPSIMGRKKFFGF